MLLTLNERVYYAFQVITGQMATSEVPSKFTVGLDYYEDHPYETSYSVTLCNADASEEDVDISVAIKYGERGVPFYSVVFGHDGEDMCSFRLSSPVVNEEPWEHTGE